MAMAMRTNLALLSLNRSYSRQREEEQQIELPHNHHGDVDWHTLGNILSAYILGELKIVSAEMQCLPATSVVVKASYVDYKHGLKAKGFKADTDWEFAYEERDVLVLRKRFKDSPIHCFMGRGVIDLPVEQVAQFVGNLETRKQWDNTLMEAKEVKRFSDVDSLRYMYHVATRCLVKSHRDFLYYVRSTFLEEKFVHTCLSVEHPILPPQPGIVRAQMQPGCGWVLEPYEGNPSKTLVSYLAHLDLMALPALIVNRVMRRQPMSIHYIRKSLISSDPFPSLSIARKRTDQHTPEDSNFTSSTYDIQREAYYEEPVSIQAFTSNKWLTLQQHSVPVEVDRHWSGDNEDRVITARPRLISEGSGDASPAISRVRQNARMHSTTTSVQVRDYNVSATSAATAHKQEETDLEGFFLNHPIPVVESDSCVDDGHCHRQQSVEKGSKGEQLGNQLQSHESPNDEKYCEEQTVRHETHPGLQETDGDLTTSGPGNDSSVEAELGLPHLPNELRSGKGVRPPKASFVTPGSSVGSSGDISASPPSVSRYLPGVSLSVTPPANTRPQHTSNGPPLYSTTGTSTGNPTVGTLVVTTTAKSHGLRSLSASGSSLEVTVQSQTDGFGTASSGSFESFHSVSPDTSDLAQPHQAFCEGPQENGLLPWQLQS